MAPAKRQKQYPISYINLLKGESEKSGKTEPENILLGELIDAGLLRGCVEPGSDGRVAYVESTGITFRGRMELQRLEEERKRATISGRLLSVVPFAGSFLFGMLSTIFVEWVKSLLF